MRRRAPIYISAARGDFVYMDLKQEIAGGVARNATARASSSRRNAGIASHAEGREPVRTICQMLSPSTGVVDSRRGVRPAVRKEEIRSGSHT